jgi:excisionase family DNA binding protein
MNATWDDEYLTVNEIAEHLKLNPQTVRNWIDGGRLPAVRIGRRVRVRRIDIDRMLTDGATVAVEPEAPVVAPTDARAQLEQALERAQRLLRRRTAARRGELAVALQELSDSVAAALELLSDESGENAS